MKIYTKTGDAGETGLLGGERTGKNSLRIHAIGALDELNASLGIARTESTGSSLAPLLYRIQNWIFDVGSELACPPGGKFELLSVGLSEIGILEASMDEQTALLPELKNFILPGGTRLAADLHLARCVCRRAERDVVELSAIEPVREEVVQFINRLSDWLFTAARTANRESHVEDVLWVKSGGL